MGVEWGEDTIVLKPFLETTTFRNVRATRVAVVNLTDDVMLFAQGAISSPQFPWVPATVVRGAVLEAACSWRELEVVAIDDTPPRSRIEARVRPPRLSARVPRLQPRRARRARGRHPRHPHASAAARGDPERSTPGSRSSWTRPPGRASSEAMAMLTEYVRSRLSR